jgi:hypothetical protein
MLTYFAVSHFDGSVKDYPVFSERQTYTLTYGQTRTNVTRLRYVVVGTSSTLAKSFVIVLFTANMLYYVTFSVWIFGSNNQSEVDKRHDGETSAP